MLDHALAGEPAAPPRRAARPLRAEGRRLRRAATCGARARGGGAPARRHRRRRRARRRRRRLRRLGALRAPACTRSARGRWRAPAPQACPVVLIVGETHVVHDAVLNSGIHELVAANGARAAAARLLPGRRGDAGAAPRALGQRRPDAARRAVGGRRRRRVPAAALRLRLRAELDGRASLRRPARRGLATRVLESDGHGGKAGYVTRVQAFLHAVQGYREAAARRAARWSADADGRRRRRRGPSAGRRGARRRR